MVFYCAATWITLACSFTRGGLQWRLPLALQVCYNPIEIGLLIISVSQLVPCIVLVAMLPLVPESPRWLLMRNKNKEGANALRRYLGKGLSIESPLVENEFRSITGAIEIERQSQISLKEIITGHDRSGHLKRLILGCGGQFMQV